MKVWDINLNPVVNSLCNDECKIIKEPITKSSVFHKVLYLFLKTYLYTQTGWDRLTYHKLYNATHYFSRKCKDNE